MIAEYATGPDLRSRTAHLRKYNNIITIQFGDNIIRPRFPTTNGQTFSGLLQKLRLPLESTAIAKYVFTVIFLTYKNENKTLLFWFARFLSLGTAKIRYLNNKSYLLSAERYVKTSIIRKLLSLSGKLMNVQKPSEPKTILIVCDIDLAL